MSKNITLWQYFKIHYFGFAVGLLAFLLFLNGQNVQAQARTTAPANWCTTNEVWQVLALTNAPNPSCKNAGQVAIDIGGTVTRYPTFAEAEAYRNGRNASFYYEASEVAPTVDNATDQNTTNTGNSDTGVAAGTTFEIVVTEDLTAQEATLIGEINWEKWLTGGTAIVFSNAEGALNVATLEKLNITGLNGAVVLLEPWALGCGSTLKNGIPQSKDPKCNPGAAWLFSTWMGPQVWLTENNFTEGSLWYRPGDSVTTEAQKTCVSALTPAGTAINIAPDQDEVWQVCPDGFSDPEWVQKGMMNYVEVQDLLKALAAEKEKNERLTGKLETFCSDPTYSNNESCTN